MTRKLTTLQHVTLTKYELDYNSSCTFYRESASPIVSHTTERHRSRHHRQQQQRCAFFSSIGSLVPLFAIVSNALRPRIFQCATTTKDPALRPSHPARSQHPDPSQQHDIYILADWWFFSPIRMRLLCSSPAASLPLLSSHLPPGPQTTVLWCASTAP